MDDDQFMQFLDLQRQLIVELRKSSVPPVVHDARAPSTAWVPNFDIFDPQKESFRNYRHRFENYIDMKGISAETSYCAKLLLNSIGAKTYETLSVLSAPVELPSLSLEALLNLLTKHLSPQKNILVAQHQFLCRHQTAQQSITDFVSALRSDIAECGFITTCACTATVSVADIFLRAQFIRGIKDSAIREKLLQSAEKSFDEIVLEATAAEASKLGAIEMMQRQATDTAGSTGVHAIDPERRGRKRREPPQKNGKNYTGQRQNQRSRVDYAALGLNGLCLRCGRTNHIARECKSARSNLKCAKCHKTGHVAKVCIKHRLQTRDPPVHYMDAEDDYDTGIYTVVDVYQNTPIEGECFNAVVLVSGRPVIFEIDSGSAYTFLPRDKFAELKLNVQLVSTDIKFRSYTGDIFVPDGKITVQVSYNGKSSREEIYIVPEKHAALVGRVWIRRLGITLQEADQCGRKCQQSKRICQITPVGAILHDFANIFEGKIGCVPRYVVSLKLREGASPIFHREREVPYALRKAVDDELDTLEATGIISKSETSDWGSPLVVIQKKDGGVRLCVDYKVGVNERLVSAHYPIRKIDDILNSLRRSRFFCTLDLYKAYLHVPVDQQSSIIQTISTHRGTYRMNRLSFGIKTAPSEFNRIIDQILRGLPKVVSYFDDIIVHGETLDECRRELEACLAQLRRFDLHLNKKKCNFFLERIQFLGHVIEHNKISKSPDKVAAIVQMPRPLNRDALRTFLGMVTYYARFIPNLSNTTAPLRRLLKNNVRYQWSPACEIAFAKLKSEICSNRVLVPFNPDLPVQLACDASPFGVAGVLSHTMKGEVERPIAFASRSLNKAEVNYSQLDREALAIVFAVQHFSQYLTGRPFTLVTDNQPLVRIFHQYAKLPKMTSARLQRYAAFLSGFHYTVVFKKGCENQNADCLSRAPVPAAPSTDSAINAEVHYINVQSIFVISSDQVNYQSIRAETRQDPELSKLLIRLRRNRVPDCDFTIDSGVLFRGHRIVIPASLRTLVLNELHRTHTGVSKMKQLARRYVYWKGIDQDIEQLVRGCAECVNIRHEPPKTRHHHWDEPISNWERVHIDYAGPFQDHHFLVVIDAKSRWIEIEAITSAPTSSSTIALLETMFAHHGFCSVLVSDNATIFTSTEFRNFCTSNGIFQKFIAPGHAATNGLAERTVQTLKRKLTAMAGVKWPMTKKIRDIVFRYRATPLACGKSPAELYLHRPLRTQLDALFPSKCTPNQEASPVSRSFQVGERVQVRVYMANKGMWKLGKVTEKLGLLHYRVKLDDGYEFKRHVDQLCATAAPSALPICPPVPPANATGPPLQQETSQAAGPPFFGELVDIPPVRSGIEEREDGTETTDTMDSQQTGRRIQPRRERRRPIRFQEFV